MENAARALLMAGGILFAIIVISVFMLGYSGMTQIQQEKEYQEAIQEVNEFNKTYLAFNKKAMYGSDMISVMNRAINNNKIYGVYTKDDEYYVDIIFSLHPDNGNIGNSEYTYILNRSTGIYTSSLTNNIDTGYGASNMIFEAGHTYSLSSLWDPVSGSDPITGLLRTANQNEETKIIDEKEGPTVMKYRIQYSGIAGLKRRAFKCSRIEYDNSGRVSAMYFDELKVSTYGG